MSLGPALRIERAMLRNGREGDRQRLERALAVATPAATGVPERALLVIRRMVLTQALPAHASERFGAGLVEAIRARKRGARRGRGAHADDDLFFEDAIELEVALVAAALEGGPATRSLVALTGGQSALMRWRARILADTRLLPPLIERLVAADLALPWLARFEPGELMRAASALLRASGGAGLPGVPASGTVRGIARAAARARRTALPDPVRSALAAIEHAREAGPSTRLLLFVALVAAGRPDMLSAAAVKALIAEIAHGHPAGTSPTGPPAVRSWRTPDDKPAHDRAKAWPAGAEAPDRDEGPARRPVPAGSGHPPVAAADFPAGMSAPADMSPIEHPSGLATDVPHGVVSRFAGLFFATNILLALGLYGDFTRPAVGLPGLSPFELMLILGKRWYGEAIERDPLAVLLRELAGLSPRGRPGRHFDAPRWHVPRDWLAAWPGARVRRRAGRRWHEAGFPLADRARPRNAARARRRWFDCLSRYVAARMAAALGEPGTAAALAMLVRCPGGSRSIASGSTSSSISSGIRS